jgi:hypothetical protein
MRARAPAGHLSSQDARNLWDAPMIRAWLLRLRSVPKGCGRVL